MKVLLCVHGYPPEQLGGTERSAQQLARGLVARGHEVVVVAGSLEVASEPGLRVSEASDGDVRVLRLHRPDLYFDHWQKSRSVRVAQELRRILQEEQPDLLHVLHWLRLSRDLVVTAARAGVPAVVSLNDHWVGCPLTFRVDPRTRASCEQPLSALGCPNTRRCWTVGRASPSTSSSPSATTRPSTWAEAGARSSTRDRGRSRDG